MLTTEKLIKKSNKLNESGNYHEVINILTDSLLKERKSAELYTERAIAYGAIGEFRHQWQDCQTSLRIDSKYFKTFYCLGNYFLNHREFTQAINFYSKAADKNPNYANTFSNKALTWYFMGMYQSAITDYNKSIELVKDAVIINNRGLTWFELGEYDKAIEDYTQAIELNPNYEISFNNRGNCWSKKGEYDKAIENFDVAIKLKPDYERAIINRGDNWFFKKDYSKALQDYNLAIESESNLPGVYNNRGVIWKIESKLDLALADFNHAIKLDPDYPDAYNNRGDVFLAKNVPIKAISDFSQAIKLHPRYKDAFANRGIAWYMLGDFDKSLEDFHAAIAIDPNFAKPYYGLGNLYLKKELFALSEANFKRAYYLDFDKKSLINVFSKKILNPLILQELVQKVSNLRTFLHYQTEIQFCEDSCERWLLLQNHFQYTSPDLLTKSSFVRIQAIMNFYLGHTIKAFQIIDNELEDSNFILRDQYYLIMAANSFLEHDNGLAYALQVIKQYNAKSSDEWYYIGQIYNLAEEYHLAEQALLQASEFLPALYCLCNLYHLQKNFSEENRIIRKIKLLEENNNQLSLLNGIASVNVNIEMTGTQFEENLYNKLYYYELLEEINIVRAALNINTIYHHTEFYDLINFDPGLLDFIRTANERRENIALFEGIVASYEKMHDDKVRNIVNDQCTVNPYIQDINEAVENAVQKYNSSYEQQISMRINTFEQKAIVYLTVIKYFYFKEKINGNEAVTLHFFTLKKAVEKNDASLNAGIDEELKSWLPVLSDTLQSPTLTRIFMKAFNRLQNGRETYKMDHYKDYASFKEKFIPDYLPWWRDTIIKNELEKHQFSRKTDMDENKESTELLNQ